MQFDVQSAQSDLNKERNFYFRKTKQGRLVFSGIVTGFAVLLTYLYLLGAGIAASDVFGIILTFMVSWPVSALLVILGFFFMDSGFHVSAAWNSTQSREIVFAGEDVEFEDKLYSIDKVRVYSRQYEAYIVFGNKVLYVNKYNCPGYSQLLSALA